MKDRSDDPSHHERTLLPRSYISLPVVKRNPAAIETQDMYTQLIIIKARHNVQVFMDLNYTLKYMRIIDEGVCVLCVLKLNKVCFV